MELEELDVIEAITREYKNISADIEKTIDIKKKTCSFLAKQ
jgi:hypothetical protein